MILSIDFLTKGEKKRMESLSRSPHAKHHLDFLRQVCRQSRNEKFLQMALSTLLANSFAREDILYALELSFNRTSSKSAISNILEENI